MASLIERVAASEATIQRYSGKPLVWSRTDCVKMVAHTLHALKVKVPLKEAGSYGSYLTAKKALKRMGHETLDAWIDSWGLRRIAPAMAIPGDVAAFRSEDPAMPALAVVLSNGRFLGFVPEIGCCAVFGCRDKTALLKAWTY